MQLESVSEGFKENSVEAAGIPKGKGVRYSWEQSSKAERWSWEDVEEQC